MGKAQIVEHCCDEKRVFHNTHTAPRSVRSNLHIPPAAVELEAVCLCMLQNAGASDRVRSRGASVPSARLSEKMSHMLVSRHLKMTMLLEKALLETAMRSFSLRSQTKVAHQPML